MSGFTTTLLAAACVAAATNSAFAQVTTMELEPNGAKTEATMVTGMVAGDCISGASTGTAVGAGNSAATTADYWDISTAAQATPGWYRWTLTITSGNDIDIRGLDVAGSVGSGSTAVAGSDDIVQNDSADEIHWYSNEGVSRLYVLVDGTASSPATYTACLSCMPISSTPVAGSFAAGSIQITTVGQTTFDTDMSVSDSTRTIIPGFLNDDDGINQPGLQSEFTRTYAPGTYYLVISDYDQNNSEAAAVDDDFVLGEVMDFPNVFAGSSTSTGDDLTFLIDDGQGNAIVTTATKGLVHGLEFFEFTVGTGGQFPDSCNGDGGDQMGCTDCPCGNNAPMGTIGGCVNSSNNSARILTSGDPSVSLASGSTTDLRFGAEGTPANAFCILNSGDALAPNNMANPCFGTGNGAQAAVFDGLRCAVANTRRHGGRSADANGDVGVTNNPWGGEGGPPAGIAVAGGGFVAGQTRFFQVIHRDDPLAVCTRGLNTSQAAAVTFTP